MASPYDQILGKLTALHAQSSALRGQKTLKQEEITQLEAKRHKLVLDVSTIDLQVGDLELEMRTLGGKLHTVQAQSSGEPSLDVPAGATTTALVAGASGGTNGNLSSTRNVSHSRNAHTQSHRAGQDIAEESPSHKFPFFDEQASTGPPSELTMLSKQYPIVVYIDGSWYELSCHLCGANTNQAGKFLIGLHGLSLHVTKSHQRSGTREYLLKELKRTVLSDEDVSRIQQNRKPLQPITPRRPGGLQRPPESDTDDSDKDKTEELFGLGSRKSLPRRDYVNQPLVSLAEYTMLSETYPTIVLVGGKWVEISCTICGANASRTRNRFFAGLHGFKIHMARAHKDIAESKLDHKDIIRMCKQRILSEADVLAISNDQPLASAILKNFGGRLSTVVTLGSPELGETVRSSSSRTVQPDGLIRLSTNAVDDDDDPPTKRRKHNTDSIVKPPDTDSDSSSE